ncbi:twin-arginine translocase subunit TatC [Carbonactinospora thermoautotrophica]|uniref:Sec-independent protein translocase protein TatC n=2 Tax=Carbonactinospora thermoautotrophica TaxID=1469144 RepID=A0A132MU91_9ACTN|nr:twin-arginine translocase subunit TatC [Carbonactinospora thermoautotrophica]KWX01280.1 Sec-independent protein translocase protein TatC [Carbonactinospora thermoautotrophica]MCX9192149.1 twin-arginine translocase subunit TatC [Carbonactinospora thermoautotrophica]
MPFTEHIRELRDRMIKSLIAILIGSVVGFYFYEPLMRLLTDPVCDLRNVGKISGADCAGGVLVLEGVLGPFTLSIKVALFAGLVLASPVWLYQVWAFLSPGLHRHEKRYALSFVSTGVPLFLVGAVFGYLILPKALDTLLGFTPESVRNQLNLEQYIDFVLRLVLVFGLSFELPLLLVLFNFMGVLTGQRMLGWWRWMVLGIFVFAAVATPTGDPITMSAMALPMTVFYFLAVGVSCLNDKRRRGADPDANLSPDEASVIDTRPSSLDDVP